MCHVKYGNGDDDEEDLSREDDCCNIYDWELSHGYRIFTAILAKNLLMLMQLTVATKHADLPKVSSNMKEHYIVNIIAF